MGIAQMPSDNHRQTQTIPLTKPDSFQSSSHKSTEDRLLSECLTFVEKAEEPTLSWVWISCERDQMCLNIVRGVVISFSIISRIYVQVTVVMSQIQKSAL